MLDFILGVIISIIFLGALLYAAITDLRTGEIANWIWGFPLVTLPIGLFRLFLTGLLLLFILQVLLFFTLILFSYLMGIMGGADGKAILLIALLYPWPRTNLVILITAPMFTLLGSFIITGIQSISLALLNQYKWRRCPISLRMKSPPEKKRYWFVRRFSANQKPDEPSGWIPAFVPLVFYILLSYLTLLVFYLII